MTNPWTPPSEPVDTNEEGASALSLPFDPVKRIADFARWIAVGSGIKMAELIEEEARERIAAGLSPFPDPSGRAEEVMRGGLVEALPFGPEVIEEMVKIGMETFNERFRMLEVGGSS